ncbi:MAG: HAD hydrolase-like protein [Nannocystaceae bacterium]
MLRALLFDLDGVLIDSLASIRSSMNHALARLGRPQLSPEAARPLIGPPLAESVPVLLETDDAARIDHFITIYREHYQVHAAATSTAMPGLREVLGRLHGRWPLAVATAKPELYARPILEGLGVADRFAAICGGSLDHHRDTKATIIGRALAALDLDGGADVVMIGDRSYDVRGAAEHGIPTIGAAYGMGGEEELREAGARWLIRGLAELPALVERLDAAP